VGPRLDHRPLRLHRTAPNIPRELDLNLLQLLTAAQVTGAGTVGTQNVELFVGTAHALGMKAYADPATSVQVFGAFASLGFDGAYCDDIPASLALQPPL